MSAFVQRQRTQAAVGVHQYAVKEKTEKCLLRIVVGLVSNGRYLMGDPLHPGPTIVPVLPPHAYRRPY